jgi:hypothetical protein
LCTSNDGITLLVGYIYLMRKDSLLEFFVRINLGQTSVHCRHL